MHTVAIGESQEPYSTHADNCCYSIMSLRPSIRYPCILSWCCMHGMRSLPIMEMLYSSGWPRALESPKNRIYQWLILFKNGRLQDCSRRDLWRLLEVDLAPIAGEAKFLLESEVWQGLVYAPGLENCSHCSSYWIRQLLAVSWSLQAEILHVCWMNAYKIGKHFGLCGTLLHWFYLPYWSLACCICVLCWS